MTEIPFYRRHWLDIDTDRLQQYESMFAWSEASRSLYEPAAIERGHIVADFGCGPGHTVMKLARLVGPNGHVFGLDINAQFIAQAHNRAANSGMTDRVTIRQSDGASLPLASRSVDRITTRNTLIYVDDPTTTLKEFHRVLKLGGRAHAIEGDWDLMVVEPIPKVAWQSLVERASVACRTPDIGRKLTGLLAKCGFREIRVTVHTRPDLTGRLLPMIRNMTKYAQINSALSASEIVPELEKAIEENTYLAVAPQFVATGVK